MHSAKRSIWAVLLALPLFFCTVASAYEMDDYVPEVTDRVARISYLSGDVTIRRGESADWETAVANLPIVEGDELWTEANGRFEIQFNSGTHIRVSENSSLKIVGLKEAGIALSLPQGNLTVRTREFNPDNAYVEVDAPKTTIYQTSAGVQRELWTDVILSADFVYTKGTNLGTLVNLNQRLPNAAGNNALGAIPYPNFGFIEWRAQNGRSEYKGVDMGIERRFSKGHAFGVSYTLADSKDNTSEHLTTQGSNSFPQNSRDLELWWGPSDYDVRHRLTTNFVAELPLGQHWLARDWVLSGIYAWRSGRPFTVNQSGNNVGQNMTGLPNQVSDDTDGPQTVEQWFNTAAFQAVTSGTFGDERRNRLRGPDWQSFDMTLQRRIRFNQRVAATVRWDVFNLFNTTNFGLPNRNISDAATFGTIATLSGDPRIMQLSARITF